MLEPESCLWINLVISAFLPIPMSSESSHLVFHSFLPILCTHIFFPDSHSCYFAPPIQYTTYYTYIYTRYNIQWASEVLASALITSDRVGISKSVFLNIKKTPLHQVCWWCQNPGSRTVSANILAKNVHFLRNLNRKVTFWIHIWTLYILYEIPCLIDISHVKNVDVVRWVFLKMKFHWLFPIFLLEITNKYLINL